MSLKTCLRHVFSLYMALLALYCAVHLIKYLNTIDIHCNYALINVIIYISTPYMSLPRFLHYPYLPHSLPLFSPFSWRAASTSTNSIAQTRCLRAVNCVPVSPNQKWVGTRDYWSFVFRQNNYRFRANHDIKLTDDTCYLMISVGGISISAQYNQDISFVTTCLRHVANIAN